MAERVWTLRDALGWTTGYFEEKGVEQPRLSAEWLLSAVTGLSRVELYAYHDKPLSAEERTAYRELVRQRAAGTPLQYVTGEVPFRHLVLKVRPGVFIPRPETEVLVDEGLAALEGLEEPVVVDCCTGSGAVALAVAQECPGAAVYATDASFEAVETARDNAERTGLAERVTILQGDLLEPLPQGLLGKVDVILANPPYIPTADLAALPREVAAFEPRSALDGGADGLDVARELLDQAAKWLRAGGLLAVELDSSRAQDAAGLFQPDFENVTVRRDLSGRDRIVLGCKKEAGR